MKYLKEKKKKVFRITTNSAFIHTLNSTLYDVSCVNLQTTSKQTPLLFYFELHLFRIFRVTTNFILKLLFFPVLYFELQTPLFSLLYICIKVYFFLFFQMFRAPQITKKKKHTFVDPVRKCFTGL